MKAKRLFLTTLLAGIAAVANADVRVLHLSPDAPAVDVLAGAADDAKSPILTNVAYPGVSDYLPLATGDYYIDVIPTGGTDAVIDVDALSIDGATDYSIAAVNTVANIEPLVLVDDNTIDPSMARLRVVHASPNAGPVDVSVDGVGVVLSGFEFKDASPYLELTTGAYNVRLLEPGTSNEIFAVEGLGVEAGNVYSAWAIGVVGNNDTPFMVMPTVDASIIPEPSSGLLALGALTLLPLVRRRKT